MISKEIEWNDNYLIFEDGRVFSKKRNKFLKPGVNSCGYYVVVLCNNGIQKTIRIHRLIALHFIPNPDNKEMVDHIDRNKTNNHISNLRWATLSENSQNQSKRCDNTSGHKGITYDKYNERYRYHKTIQGKTYRKYFKNKIDSLCYKYIILLRQQAGQL